MKTVLIILFSLGVCFAQSFRMEAVKGEVKAQIGTGENWQPIGSGEKISGDALITTGKNSSVEIAGDKSKLILKSYAAVKLSNIKKMSINDLLLALAMEDMLNAPKKNEEINSKNTAVYGAEVNGIKSPMIESSDLGIKKLNGAVQLSENGYRESAVVAAKEAFRKYPETKKMANYRIYFANILFDLGLNEDAYDEFKSIEFLKLNSVEKNEVASKIDMLTKKLMRD